MSTMRKPFFIASAILLAGIGGFVVLASLREEPPKIERPRLDPLVTTVVAQESDGTLTVSGNGTVRPVRQVALIAQVGGKIVFKSSRLESGAVFREGDVLARIEDTDYANAALVAEAEVTRAELELVLAREESDVARDEWQRLARRTGGIAEPETTSLGSLVFKEPQVRLAAAQLEGARARLSDARLRLDRTVIRAPFTGRVASESIAVGQVVGTGQSLAVVYATDELEVAVPLASEDAALLPAIWSADAPTSAATVRAEFGGRAYDWGGYVHRVEGTVDSATRTVSVVVRVPTASESAETPPLMVGTFTSVDMTTARLDHYFELPIEALRSGETVWVVESGRLRIRPVTVFQERDDVAVVTDGLNDGDLVIVSGLGVVADGMSVRTDDQ
jgi:RND family efflux transporter MFP subunit